MLMFRLKRLITSFANPRSANSPSVLTVRSRNKVGAKNLRYCFSESNKELKQRNEDKITNQNRSRKD